MRVVLATRMEGIRQAYPLMVRSIPKGCVSNHEAEDWAFILETHSLRSRSSG